MPRAGRSCSNSSIGTLNDSIHARLLIYPNADVYYRICMSGNFPETENLVVPQP